MAAEYDVHRKSYKYGLDDWQLLVNILHEYSEKLLIVSRQLSKNKRNNPLKIKGVLNFENYRYPLINLLSFFPLSFATVSVITLSFSAMNRNLTWQGFATSSGATIIVTIICITLLQLSQRKSNSWNISDDHYFSLELIEKDARVMSSRLESAIRLTIAVADQVEISLAKKLEMDLRIDEASYALECYYSVSGEKPSTYQENHKY